MFALVSALKDIYILVYTARAFESASGERPARFYTCADGVNQELARRLRRPMHMLGIKRRQAAHTSTVAVGGCSHLFPDSSVSRYAMPYPSTNTQAGCTSIVVVEPPTSHGRTRRIHPSSPSSPSPRPNKKINSSRPRRLSFCPAFSSSA